jgi:hypothetical protein
LAGALQVQPSPQRQSAPQPQSQGWQAQGSQGQVIIFDLRSGLVAMTKA